MASPAGARLPLPPLAAPLNAVSPTAAPPREASFGEESARTAAAARERGTTAFGRKSMNAAASNAVLKNEVATALGRGTKVAAIGALVVAAVLGANFALTLYSLELMKELRVGNDGVLKTPGSNTTVKVASVDTRYEPDVGLVGSDGQLVKTKPGSVGASSFHTHHKLQSEDPSVLNDALDVLHNLEKIRPHPLRSDVGMQLEFARYTVTDMEVFNVPAAEGTDEPPERVAVAHTNMGKFFLDGGWAKMNETQYTSLTNGESHRAPGETRRKLFCCSCNWWGKKRKLLQTPAKSSPQNPIPGPQSSQPTCNQMINNFATRMAMGSASFASSKQAVALSANYASVAADYFRNELDTFFPTHFEDSYNVLNLLGECHADFRYLENAANKNLQLLDLFYPNVGHRYIVQAFRFYEFAVETSSSNCGTNPHPACTINVLQVINRNRYFKVDNTWCNVAPSVLQDIFCQKWMGGFINWVNQDIQKANMRRGARGLPLISYVNSIFDHCGLMYAYVSAFAKYADEEDFDICKDSGKIFREIITNANANFRSSDAQGAGGNNGDRGSTGGSTGGSNGNGDNAGNGEGGRPAGGPVGRGK